MGLLTAALFITSGLILSVSALGSLPKIGAGLARAGRVLAPFGVVIGVVDIILGVLELLDLLKVPL